MGIRERSGGQVLIGGVAAVFALCDVGRLTPQVGVEKELTVDAFG